MYRNDMRLPKIGANITIRRLEERDLTELYALESDPEVKRFMGGPVPKPSDQWIAGMREILPVCGVLSILATDKLRLAGIATLGHYMADTSTRCRELTILIAKAFWGRGLGEEASRLLMPAAFSELRADRVVVNVHPENRASLKLAAKLGFAQAGVIREPGTWQDGHLVFALSSPRRIT
jgi:ribosomal-protein-alanine N-acetyltransferase